MSTNIHAHVPEHSFLLSTSLRHLQPDQHQMNLKVHKNTTKKYPTNSSVMET